MQACLKMDSMSWADKNKAVVKKKGQFGTLCGAESGATSVGNCKTKQSRAEKNDWH